jgi:NAD(P)-dependent dehydrogenase (short-subunit alcohol dehydrogenase family)
MSPIGGLPYHKRPSPGFSEPVILHLLQIVEIYKSGWQFGAVPGIGAGKRAYSDTKLHDVLLAFAVARRWPEVLSNAVSPGWVATRMGGPGAPDDLDQGNLTQAWLAVSDDPEARVTGGYFYHKEPARLNSAAHDLSLQDRLLDYCRDLTGIALT